MGDIIRARAARTKYFKATLFSDPAWDMLLQLYWAAVSGEELSVKSVAHGSGTPWATALRWINILLEEGLIERERDTRDGRRTLVRLSEGGLTAMENYLASLPPGTKPL